MHSRSTRGADRPRVDSGGPAPAPDGSEYEGGHKFILGSGRFGLAGSLRLCGVCRPGICRDLGGLLLPLAVRARPPIPRGSSPGDGSGPGRIADRLYLSVDDVGKCVAPAGGRRARLFRLIHPTLVRADFVPRLERANLCLSLRGLLSSGGTDFLAGETAAPPERLTGLNQRLEGAPQMFRMS